MKRIYRLFWIVCIVIISFFPITVLAKESQKYGYEIINVYPHDSGAFTQGLIYKDGFLYESTGRYGHSSLRKVELKTGKVLQKIIIDRELFAEGLASSNDQLVLLSWRAGTGFIYKKDDFDLTKTFNYPGEGWGLTSYKNQFIMSDGSSILRFLDPVNFTEIKRLQVSRSGRPLKNLNELEMVNGYIFANIWQTSQLAIISPESGQLAGIVNLAGLLKKYAPGVKADVLNGIAYDAEGDRLFVTGKYWPKLFEIKLVSLKKTN
jgi:glutaminyl-peptide cyclotransferase